MRREEGLIALFARRIHSSESDPEIEECDWALLERWGEWGVGAGVGAEFFGAGAEVLIGDLGDGVEIEVEIVPIVDFVQGEIVGSEFEGAALIPGGFDLLHDGFGFEAVLDESDFAGAVIGEVHGHRGVADFFSFHQDECAGRVGGDHHSSMDATGG